MMVLKAGDNLEKFVSTATPEQLIQLFLIGVKQRDDILLKAAVGEKQLQQIYSKVKKIEALNYKKDEIEEKIKNSPLVVKGKVKILTIAVEKGKGQTSLSMEFDLERSAVNDLWEIKQVNFK